MLILPSPEPTVYPSYIPAAATQGLEKNEQHQTNVELMKEVRAVPRVNCHIYLHGSRWEKQAPGSSCGSSQPTAQGLGVLELSKRGLQGMDSSGCLQLTALSEALVPALNLPAVSLPAGSDLRVLSPPPDSVSHARGHKGTVEASPLQQGWGQDGLQVLENIPNPAALKLIQLQRQNKIKE